MGCRTIHLDQDDSTRSEAAVDLFWFDSVARRAIDPALETVRKEAEKRDADYAVTVTPTASPSRDRCLLTIANRIAMKALMSGGCSIIAVSEGKVRIERAFRWVDSGKPIVVATLNSADVTQAEITRLVREFVDDFFKRASEVSP
jgi:hypothetical protein